MSLTRDDLGWCSTRYFKVHGINKYFHGRDVPAWPYISNVIRGFPRHIHHHRERLAAPRLENLHGFWLQGRHNYIHSALNYTDTNWRSTKYDSPLAVHMPNKHVWWKHWVSIRNLLSDFYFHTYKAKWLEWPKWQLRHRSRTGLLEHLEGFSSLHLATLLMVPYVPTTYVVAWQLTSWHHAGFP